MSDVVNEFATAQGKVRTMDVDDDRLTAGAVIVLDGVMVDGEIGNKLQIVTRATADNPHGWLYVRDWGTETGPHGDGFHNNNIPGHRMHMVIEADDPDVAAFIA